VSRRSLQRALYRIYRAEGMSARRAFRIASQQAAQPAPF